MGESKDEEVQYQACNLNFSSWCHLSPKWHGYIFGGYSKTYNFSREFLAYYSWLGGEISWQALKTLDIGTSANAFIEGNPEGNIEDVTYNARPYISATPINNLNIRFYFDNVFVRSSDHLEQTIFGFLFSYNFSPKSWIYFAVNEIRDRSDQYGSTGYLLPNRLHIIDRAGVFKVKYLYYF